MIKLWLVMFLGGFILGSILDRTSLPSLTVTAILLMWALGCATISAFATKRGGEI